MVYAVETFTTAGGDAARFGKPATATGGPLLVYCHGLGGDETEFSLADYDALRSWMLSNGWAWVEANGTGPGWGNDAQRAAYRAAYDHVTAGYAVTDVVLFGRSHGGIVSSWLYLYDTAIAPKAKGLILCAGVQDLIWGYDSGGFSTTIKTAYGTTSRPATVTAVTGHNPIGFPAADYAGKAVLFQYGDADTVVDPSANVLAQQARVASVLTVNQTDVAPGGDHYVPRARVAAHTAFLQTVATPPPTPEGIYRISAEYLFTGGQRYAIAPKA